MNILIIEDEPVAADRLKAMLRQADNSLNIVAVLDSVDASIRYLQTQPAPDLIFMDIELGDGQSFGIFDKVNVDTPVIFITAYQQHALKAFKHNSVDYLLKPLNNRDLEGALQKWKRLQQKRTGKTSSTDSSGSESNITRRSRFLAKVGTRLTSVPVENIAYFYTRGKQFYIKTKSSEDLLFDKCLEEIENELDDQYFFRANRQFIIGYNAIAKVQAWYSGKLKVDVTPSPYEDIIVSRLRAGEFKKWLGE